jgi:hypothetical protein
VRQGRARVRPASAPIRRSVLLACLAFVPAATLAAGTSAGADTAIMLTPRPHMDAATFAVYNRIRSAEGLLLGLGEVFAPPPSGARFDPLYDASMSRWRELYSPILPACYEFEMGEANRRTATREWDAVARFADLGGLPWLQLSLNNFSVPYGGRTARAVLGGMNDTRGGLEPVLPGGACHQQFMDAMTRFAAEVKALGRPCVLRPFHEMNGRWFWWAGDPVRYKALWQMVFDLFRTQGVTNVIWCWAPSADSPRATDYYPGDDAVDILGTSQYFDAAALPASSHSTLQELAALAPDKPLWLAELGPLARVDFWTVAAEDFQRIPHLRGFNLWLARGWQVWGGAPERGSLVDETSSPELKQAFMSFLQSPSVIGLDRFAGH